MPKYYKNICELYHKIISRLQELVKEFYPRSMSLVGWNT